MIIRWLDVRSELGVRGLRRLPICPPLDLGGTGQNMFALHISHPTASPGKFRIYIIQMLQLYYLRFGFVLVPRVTQLQNVAVISDVLQDVRCLDIVKIVFMFIGHCWGYIFT